MEEYQSTDPGAAGLAAFFGAFMMVYFVLVVLMVVCLWKIFVKAGKPGWAAIVPIYNIIVFLEIIRKPVWWIILLILFPISIIFGIIAAHKLSESFGYGVGMTLLLIFLPFIGLPVLAFGDSKYQGTSPVAQPI